MKYFLIFFFQFSFVPFGKDKLENCFKERKHFSNLLLPNSRMLHFATFLFFCASTVSGYTVTISSASGLTQFSNNVNSGSTYYGTTVLLDADVDLSGYFFYPIGKTTSYYFRGTFDGQGYTISNLRISSSYQFMGLFGYTRGSTTRNVVLDSSCYVSSSYSSSNDHGYVGGVVSWCYSYSNPCLIENCVNMASVYYSGYTYSSSRSGYLYIGGIVGLLSYSNYYLSVNNCANYASTTSSGRSEYTYVGGIVGYCSGSSYYCYVQNCLNYGSISCGSNAYRLHVGGISGRADYGKYENCFSSGSISYSSYDYVGNIVAYADSSTYITHCLWTSSAGSSAYGGGSPSVSDSYRVTLDASAINNMNSYATSYGWNKWLLNSNGWTIYFKINNNKPLSYSSSVILLPDVRNSPYTFNGWYSDSAFTVPISNYTAFEGTQFYGSYGTLYTIIFDLCDGGLLSSRQAEGKPLEFPATEKAKKEGHSFTKWNTTLTTVPSYSITISALFLPNNYTLTFDFGNGTVINQIYEFNNTVEYPGNITKEGYSHSGWYPKPSRMPANDTTVIAQWIINNYTLTFNYGNGTVIIQTYEFNSTVEYPGNLTMEGHTFDKWDKDITFMPANDTTVIAQWIINNYTLTFNYGNGTTSSKVIYYDEIVPYPTVEREGHSHAWIPDPERMPADNITITLQWTINNYILSFDFGNGTVISQTYAFNSTIEYPNISEREGYTFDKWDIKLDRMPARDTEVKVQWTVNSYYMTFDFANGTVLVKELYYNHTIKYPSDPVKEGYTFSGWSSNPDRMPARDVVLTALWIINNYTLSFDFGNGTVINETLNFSDTISYPENPERDGYTFVKWEPSPDKMPAHDLVTKANWTEARDDGANVIEIVIWVTVPVFILIIIIILVVAIVVLLKKNKKPEKSYERKSYDLGKPLIGAKYVPNDDGDDDDDYDDDENDVPAFNGTRFTTVQEEELNGDIAVGKTLDSLYKMYPPSYVKPTVKDALAKAGLSEKKSSMICSACQKAALSAKGESMLFKGFTEDDAAAIAMYTYDFGYKEFECNPYRIVNISLVDRNFNSLQKASGILYLVMTALRKLPRVSGMMLYRGVRGEVNLDKDHYREGNIITWPALSSTSPDMKTIKIFLTGKPNRKTNRKNRNGTLFIIEDGWGYDIQPYSLFPGEAEILLEPERQFRVLSVIQAEDVDVITLKMLDTPISLTKIFGAGKGIN